MAATIIVRALGPTGDPLFGNGQSDFLTDIDAVAQIITTTLKLFKGEWWENVNLGTPMFQSILGVGGASNTAAVSSILQNVIRGCPYVSDISNLTCTYNPANRAINFSCTVLTAFGTLQVSN